MLLLFVRSLSIRSKSRALCRFVALLLAAISPALSGGQDIPKEDPEANPGRPTVSTPATLTPVGYLQFETGILGAEHSGEFANRTAIEETIKFAVSRRVQFLVQSEPVVRSDLGPAMTTDAGGISLGTQVILLPSAERRPTVSLSYFRSVYSGSATDLDIGSSRNSLLLLISGDVRKFHIDTNYIFNEQIGGTAHRLQTGQTLSISHPVQGKLAFTGELWHFTQPFLNGHAAGLLLAPSYSATKRLVFDAGFDHGLTDSSTRWEFFGGFTYLLPKKAWFR
jgi:hypothetical protein